MSKAKEKQEWIEVPIFIHGMTPDAKDRCKENEFYRPLLRRVNISLGRVNKEPLLEKNAIYVEWGWGKFNTGNCETSKHDDKWLAEAERVMYESVLEKDDESGDKPNLRWALGAGYGLRYLWKRIREVFIFGLGDAAYYMSKKGGVSIRNAVFGRITKRLKAIEDKDKTKRFSLTFFCHSFGVPAAYNLLYDIVTNKSLSKDDKDKKKRDLPFLRDLYKERRLRIRKFYTFGSTQLLMLYNFETAKLIANYNKLDLHERGLGHVSDGRNDDLQNPCWVNFWDRDDILSYPLDFMYKKEIRGKPGEKIVADQYMDLGILFPGIHSDYWFSREMAKHIAETF